MFQFKVASVVALACLPALGLTALRPTPATAATAGWKVNGTFLTGSSLVLSTATVDNEFKMKAAGIAFACPSNNLTNIGATMVAPNKGEATTIVLKECASQSPSCKIPSTITVVPIVGETTLDGLLAVKAVIKPKTKTVYATIKFEGAECALLGVEPITGQGSGLSPTGQDERTLQQIISTTTEASGELKVGSSPAEVVGSALIQLLSGERWSFL